MDTNPHECQQFLRKFCSRYKILTEGCSADCTESEIAGLAFPAPRANSEVRENRRLLGEGEDFFGIFVTVR